MARARAAQQEWDFSDITVKFGRDVKTSRRPRVQGGRRWTALPAGGTAHVGAWLTAVSVSLICLVAIHVGLLQKNMELNELIREKNSLTSENARLASEIAGLNSPERIESIASGSLGMKPPGKVQYVYIGPASARQNVASIEPVPVSGSAEAAAP